MNAHGINATEPILDAVVRRLKTFKGRIGEIGRATGIEPNSIHRIVRGENKNPGVQTLQPLIDWLNVQATQAPPAPLNFFDTRRPRKPNTSRQRVDA